jgi:hypothetical protein
MSEYVPHVITAGGTVALLVVIFRYGADAVVRLVAGVVAIITSNTDRRKTCLKILRILRGGKDDDDDDPPPPLPGSP